ncbi:hypothetical protein ALC60_02642 [Trachymyrmex zeteki]|uniref:Uncharacterized protein n=1 Tax=Mycetomoellerius zeteki TaxID=64791 RepID=A0A151XCW8_9HYME|nr:PREDICTED: putative leucine-rich repeat-containing protein DDB_G0290503 isoform X3 [Trachymyrmex zeteki]KYQ58222.1 hypothetical protein ALC60_02642 [Trachymyrmex zeteki]
MSKICKAAAVKTKSLGNYRQTFKAHDAEQKKRVTMSPSNEVIMFGQDHIIEVTVKKKNKAQKRTSPVASCSHGQKAEKIRSTTDSKTPNWSNVFSQNLLPRTKQQSSKYSGKEVEKNINVKKQQKSTIKHSPMKSDQKHSPSCCSSILVQDCAVQCSEYDFNKLADFNPVHMLHLIRQLKELVNKKDKRICEIFTEMEQILQKIPDLETKVEFSTVPLKESGKKIKTVSYESFILERERLKSEIRERDERLKEVDQKYAELTFQVEMLTQQLEEATYKKNDTISNLMQQIENNERTITDLKTNLNKQTELARKNDIDNKCLIMEIHKLSALCSNRDTQIIDYRNTIQELQNQIEKHLKTLYEIYMKEGSTSPYISLIHTGHACSSPTSSFSNDFNKSWNDLSDISLEDSVPKKHVLKEDVPVKDFELVSLLDGESSHTILPDQNEVKNEKKSVRQNNNENNTACQNMNANDVTTKKSLHQSSKKDDNKENDIHKMTKYTTLKEKQNDYTKNLFLNASKVLESITKSTVSDIRKQGDMQNKKPVNVPSPLRDCPYPDWSDSSLPSISTVSDLDMVPSNDV